MLCVYDESSTTTDVLDNSVTPTRSRPARPSPMAVRPTPPQKLVVENTCFPSWESGFDELMITRGALQNGASAINAGSWLARFCELELARRRGSSSTQTRRSAPAAPMIPQQNSLLRRLRLMHRSQSLFASVFTTASSVAGRLKTAARQRKSSVSGLRAAARFPQTPQVVRAWPRKRCSFQFAPYRPVATNRRVATRWPSPASASG